ncbi:LpqB family beta-propeller domain-containing protein [Corallococcus sp. EGB]|uniref:LpqB family beta-propeller domain-containing protein n=1 Tax=Corallococcus sp. EGB TaxID=1521117 RepID=UPI001CC1177A|nr:LpqB family beta-propeller domain-containing protein [Corallococcus sp. EGB]
MNALPPALRPWAAQLSLFPEDLARHLGPHVARLSAAVGTLRPRGEAEGGEPQGYDGLACRGTFERLLVSEWLWALEAPEELVRRAAFGELSFLKPAFRQPQGARRTVVLLDVGPDQLGLPRIAHLALLVVLARRAEAVGAAFTWGALQTEPARATHEGLSGTSLLAWLDARSPVPASPAHLAAWREALSLSRAPEDVWLVGSSRLGRLEGSEGMSRVEVSEPMEPGAHRLSVDVRPAARVPHSVVLELPPRDDCVRLLRNPFASSPKASGWLPRKAGQRMAKFSFSGDGRRVLLFSGDGAVEAMAVPHSPRATVPKPRRVQVPPGQRVVAAGWRSSGGLLVLARDRDTYVMHGHVRTPNGYRKARYHVAGDFNRPDTASDALPLSLMSWVDPGGREHLWVKNEKEALFSLAPLSLERSSEIKVEEEGVSAMAEVAARPVCVVRPRGVAAGPAFVISRLRVLCEEPERTVPLNARGGDAYFGYSPSGAHPDAGLLAVRDKGLEWRLFLDTGVSVVAVPEGHRVVGVVQPPAPSLPGLIALDPDHRTFHLFSRQPPRTLAMASGPVVQAAASHGQAVLGWLTQAGEFVLWDLMEQAVLFRSLQEATP